MKIFQYLSITFSFSLSYNLNHIFCFSLIFFILFMHELHLK